MSPRWGLVRTETSFDSRGRTSPTHVASPMLYSFLWLLGFLSYCTCEKDITLGMLSAQNSFAYSTTVPIAVPFLFKYQLVDHSSMPISEHLFVSFWFLSSTTPVIASFNHSDLFYFATLETHSYTDLLYVLIDGVEFDVVHVTTYPPFTSAQELARATGEAAVEDFGDTVAVCGDTLLVGAPSLSQVSVFKQRGEEWTLTSILGPLHAADSRFGASVAASPLWIAVGAPQYQAGATAGAVFLYLRLTGTWTLRDTLLPVGAANGDAFGTSVSLSGAYLLVGAPGATVSGRSAQGYARMYTFSLSAWDDAGALYVEPQTAGDAAGTRCAVEGSLAAVGTVAGTVGIFEEASGVWTFAAFLDGFASTAPIPQISSKRVFVGDGDSDTIHIFEKPRNGDWADATPTMIAGPEGVSFGFAFSVAGNVLAVGARDYALPNGVSGSYIIFSYNDAIRSWGIIARGTGTAANTFLGRAAATDGQTVAFAASSTGDASGVVLVLSSSPSLVVVANATVAAPDADGVSDFVITLLDANDNPVESELTVKAAFELPFTDFTWEGADHTGSLTLPPDLYATPLILSISGFEVGNYILNSLPVEVRSFFFPSSAVSVSTSSDALVGRDIEVTVTLSDHAFSTSLPVSLLFNGNPVPTLATPSGNTYSAQLRTPGEVGNAELIIFRFFDANKDPLSVLVPIASGAPDRLVVFPRGFMQDGMYHFAFGLIDSDGVPVKDEHLVDITLPSGATTSSVFNATHGWYEHTVTYIEPIALLPLSATVHSSPSMNIAFTVFFSHLQSVPVQPTGEPFSVQVMLLDRNDLQVADGRSLIANFGNRHSLLGCYFKKDASPALSVPQSGVLDTFIPEPRIYESNCGYLKTNLALTLFDSPSYPRVDGSGSSVLGLHWISERRVVIEFEGQLLTFKGAENRLLFCDMRPSLRGQSFLLSDDPSGSFGVYSGLYPLAFTTTGIWPTTTLRDPTEMHIQSTDCLGDSLQIDIEDGPSFPYGYLFYANDGSAFLNVAPDGTVSTGSFGSASLLVLIVHDADTASLLDEATGLMVHDIYGNIATSLFIPETLWTLDQEASPIRVSTASVGELQLTALGEKSSRLSNYNIIGADVPITSSKWGHALIAPAVANSAPTLDPVDWGAPVLPASPAQFTIVHNGDQSAITYGEYVLCFVSDTFLWKTDQMVGGWFSPVAQSYKYNTYLLKYTTDKYISINSVASLAHTTAHTEDRLIEFGQERFFPLRGQGKKVFVMNKKDRNHMRNLLKNIFPDITVHQTDEADFENQDPKSSYDLLTMDMTDCGINNYAESGCATFRRFNSYLDSHFRDDSVSYLGNGGNMLFTHDTCTSNYKCGSTLESYLGIDSDHEYSRTTMYTVSYSGAYDDPIVYFLSDPWSSYSIAKSHTIKYKIDGTQNVVFRFPDGTAYAWLKETTGSRVAYSHTGHMAEDSYSNAITPDDEMITRAMLLWTLHILD
eukprot:gnl/Chilomastix_cuspidata/2127.p1 GENE.gnl/Chilomastix_cuspidata/2127~~gnl/Chilomastix_cuspidata/2127.p1  ORF type:complete len:1466 (-),score=204.14 gnl/Chilomastix_cuspidata/2127:25-4422(-)